MATVTVTIDGGEEVAVVRNKDGSLEQQFTCPECKIGNKAYVEAGGIWACTNCGASGTCDHSDTRIESLTTNHMGADGHYQSETDAYICNWCESITDGNPAQDIAEAIADMQGDEWGSE